MKTDLTDLEVGELPAGGPLIVVAPADAASTPAGRYRQAGRPGDVQPWGKQLVALVRSGELSTGDTFEVTDASQNGNEFRVTLEIHRYVGPISANVERETIVQAELGSLSPGRYLVVVTWITSEFENLQHSERVANPSSAVERLEFDAR